MRGKASAVVAMIIFGSIGIFVKNINLSSLEIALLRAIIGSIFLAGVGFIIRKKISIKDIKANGLLLILSGAAIGLNWILLFQAYKYTTISNATLGYYFAPIFIVILSPIVLKEKFTLTKVVCSFIAMLGLFLIINAGSGNEGVTYNHLTGMVYATAGAAVYASIVLMNKYIKDLPGFETTLIQLVIGAVVLLPVVLLQSNSNILNMGAKSWMNMLILGIVHTGIGYLLYFLSVKELAAQHIAILSYIDPISAVIMATIFLGEKITFIKVIGGILILGSAYFGGRLDTGSSAKQDKKTNEIIY